MNVIKLEDLIGRLEQRKAELNLVGNAYVKANSGVNRTPEKRALLQSIYDQCKLKGQEPPFNANF